MTPNLAASLKKYKVVDNVGDGLVPVEKKWIVWIHKFKR